MQYLLDEDEFGKEFYYPIRTQWAYAYPKHCNINTNMHLESMHRALKYYFDGKNQKTGQKHTYVADFC
nr:unnamed protein product [Callosobruchus analis]